MRTHKHFRQNRPKKSQLIAGTEAVLDAIENGVEIERIFVQNNISHTELKKAADEKNIPLSKVPQEKIKGFNIDAPGGVIALKSKIIYQELQNVISWVFEKGEVPLFLILDGITDIRNIGGLARTAWCCGVHALVIPQKGVGALNDDAIATSAGALEHLSVCRVRDLEEAVDTLQLNGISVWASEMTASKNIYDINATVPAAIIMGSEDKGIQPSLYKKSDVVFKIPMKNNFESLNVSAATAMILYEVMKQRLTT